MEQAWYDNGLQQRIKRDCILDICLKKTEFANRLWDVREVKDDSMTISLSSYNNGGAIYL